MESFTGIDINRAEEEIQLFYQKVSNVQRDIRNCHRDFFTMLSRKWASPNAKTFTTKKISSFLEVDREFEKSYRQLIKNAINAAKKLAEAGGDSFIFDFNAEVMPDNKNYSDWICPETLNGEIGMDTTAVQYLIDVYDTSMNRMYSLLDDLPENISLYDPAGKILDAYNGNIRNFKSKYEELMKSTEAELKGYIATEKQNLIVAKNHALDVLNNMF